MIPPTLCLMLKAPRPGFVKTRLAREIGAAAAGAIYRSLVESQLLAAPPEWPIEIHYTPDDAEAEMSRWLAPLRPTPLAFYPQPGGDLGARLEAALSSAFERGAGAVLFAGGDCPALDRQTLLQSAEVLKSADVVIVPARDGGYVLIGLAAPRREIFAEIAWSTPSVLSETLERARQAGLKATTLHTLEDVDDIESLTRAQSAGFLPRGL